MGFEVRGLEVHIVAVHYKGSLYDVQSLVGNWS